MDIVMDKADLVIYRDYDLIFGRLEVPFNILLWGYYHCEFDQREPLLGLRLHLGIANFCLFVS